MSQCNDIVLPEEDGIITSIWGPDDFASHEQDLDRLAMEICKIFGQIPTGEQWLKTLLGAGYLLQIDTES
ncbi:hypothetical protein H6G45_04445 [Synechocystis sp. FACHB-383]|uniref:hypothetical protein n=1 Tax=unclassified Synechocystis TaxID=2640012 RepID=UPI00168A0E80|nr:MULTISPECIES: hypothetical protein [unclassified Synechocystis]MBD2652758.1 hypothetical protein [Synechocystis sp. FACHB-383]MBE9194555.1 hypothetical protein [Synechocystis sp. LEGE 06083]